MTQMLAAKLHYDKYQISVVFATSTQMVQEIAQFAPDIIIAPFLTKFVPSEIYDTYPTYIMHPGIAGDKGPHSLEHTIIDKLTDWGSIFLRATSELDGGSIYARGFFPLRYTYKASLYRNEVVGSVFFSIDELLANHNSTKFTPLEQPSTPMHKKILMQERMIDWETDTTQTIVNKIYQSDSAPGVRDNLLGVPCYLFGAWSEEKLKASPKQIIAKREGAICLGTVDGAVWITHLKEEGKFKLPATYVLKDKLAGIKESRIPLVFDKSYATFYEIGCEIKNEVAYLHFNFHNGAFSSDKCIRLKCAIEYLSENAKVIVLVGGDDFFSNGIHLSILEDSKKQGEDGWSNINAMNNLVETLLYLTDTITVASFSKNAGAGGVFLGLACDYVVGKESATLNPHYKTIGLSGSEYHTHSLPNRVGKEKAQKLLDDCLPICMNEAKDIGMIDEVFAVREYEKSLAAFCENIAQDENQCDDFLREKEEYLEQNQAKIQSCKEAELAIMHPEFWDEASSFHQLRHDFIYKIATNQTPERLKQYARI